MLHESVTLHWQGFIKCTKEGPLKNVSFRAIADRGGRGGAVGIRKDRLFGKCPKENIPFLGTQPLHFVNQYIRID